MKNQRIGPCRGAAWLGLCVTCAIACGSDAGGQTRPGAMPSGGNEPPNTDHPNHSRSGDSPFESVEAAANAPGTFGAPRAGVPLDNGAVAFIATQTAASEEDGAHLAVFLQAAGSAPPRVLYAGDQLVSPLDIETSADGETLYVADYAGGSAGTGAILSLPATGGDVTALAQGWSPRSVTWGPNGQLYFSGVDPESGEPGVFRLGAGAVTPVFRGAPLVDPSGIAVFRDGSLLVVDTRLFDTAIAPNARAGDAGIVRIADGKASVFATGFSTGFPAGIALTLDESMLFISGQGADRSDTVYLVDVARPELAPTPITASFSIHQDSSAGLKRAHGKNTFILASLSADGGTLFELRN